MTYADAQLLLEFAKLQARIAAAHDPVAQMDTVKVNLTSTKGYRDLRAWYSRLSVRAKDQARRYLTMQIEGTRDVMRRFDEGGEKPSLAELTIEINDSETGEPVDGRCKGSGAGITDSETGEPVDGRCKGSGAGITDPVDGRIACSKCKASWHVHDVAFKIPSHEET